MAMSPGSRPNGNRTPRAASPPTTTSTSPMTTMTRPSSGLTELPVEETGLRWDRCARRSGRRQAEVVPAAWSQLTAAGCPRQEADLHQVRFDDVFDRLDRLGDRRRHCREADRAATVVLGDRAEQLAIHRVEPALVDVQQGQRIRGERLGDGVIFAAANLRVVADALEQPVRDA